MNRKFNHISGTRTNLRNNGPFQLSLRHTLSIYNSNSIYSFIPKNACSTMRYTIARANGFIDSAKDINWIHANNNTFNADIRTLANADYTFVILRCPFARLASVFLDKFVKQEPDAFQYYNSLDRTFNLTDLTFRQFVNSLTKPKILKSNIHWRPQIDFLVYQEYDDYFSVEKFKEAEAKLEERINLKVFDARKLTNHGIDGLDLVKQDCNNSDLTIFDLMLMRKENKIISPQTLYDEDIYESVKKLYAGDIALYINKFGNEDMVSL